MNMTRKQFIKFYLANWKRAWDANWRMDRGCAVSIHEELRSPLIRQVDAAARQKAARLNRAPKEDDYRHAAHIAALGRAKSSKDLDNRELDRVVVIFRLIADPDDLSATMDHANPSRPDRRRCEWSIRNCGMPEAYIAAVSSQKYGTKNWISLNDAQLAQLMITLKSRVRSRAQLITPKIKTQPKPEPQPQNHESSPF